MISLYEVIAAGETGILVPENSVERIAEALIAMLSDQVNAQRMGCAGRNRVAAWFSQSRTANQMLKIERLQVLQ